MTLAVYARVADDRDRARPTPSPPGSGPAGSDPPRYAIGAATR